MATLVHLLGVDKLKDLTSEQYALLLDVLKYEARALAWDKETETSQHITAALQDALGKIKAGS